MDTSALFIGIATFLVAVGATIVGVSAVISMVSGMFRSL